MNWRLLVLAASPALLLNMPGVAYSESDGKPLRLIVPYAPGHPVDRLARLLSENLREQAGQTVVVDNRPAVDGLVGTEMVANSLPDGHTVGIVSSEHAMYAALGRRLPYHPTRDFTPVTQLADRQLLLVTHPELPVNTVKELIALAKKEPGKLRYASRSPLDALPVELFKISTGTRIERAPDARSITEAVDDQIRLDMAEAALALPHVKESRLRALAIGDSRRSEIVPDLPTLAESGVKGYQAVLWAGILAPPKTPKGVVDRLNGAMVKVVRSPTFREPLAQHGADAVGSTPAEWSKFITTEIAKWRKVAQVAKLKFD
jgi:tripartite-type tricarboxylate transporter receptor subunit TctC